MERKDDILNVTIGQEDGTRGNMKRRLVVKVRNKDEKEIDQVGR